MSDTKVINIASIKEYVGKISEQIDKVDGRFGLKPMAMLNSVRHLLEKGHYLQAASLIRTHTNIVDTDDDEESYAKWQDRMEVLRFFRGIKEHVQDLYCAYQEQNELTAADEKVIRIAIDDSMPSRAETA